MIKINGDKVPANRCDPADPKGCSDKEKIYCKTREKIWIPLVLKKKLLDLKKCQQKNESIINWLD